MFYQGMIMCILLAALPGGDLQYLLVTRGVRSVQDCTVSGLIFSLAG